MRSPIQIHVPQESEDGGLGSIGKRIMWARQQLELTQKAVADRIGKSRATVVQYERDNLTPTLEQIVNLASALNVAPEFIAFGRQAISGIANAAAEIISITEYIVAEEESISGGYGLPIDLVRHFGIEADRARIYVVTRGMPAFGYEAGDRLITNTVEAFGPGHELYVVRAEGGIEVVRLLPNLSQSGNDLNLTGSHSQSYSLPTSEIRLLGAVVGSIRGR